MTQVCKVVQTSVGPYKGGGDMLLEFAVAQRFCELFAPLTLYIVISKSIILFHKEFTIAETLISLKPLTLCFVEGQFLELSQYFLSSVLKNMVSVTSKRRE